MMWNDDFAPVCRTYPELVAVYESPDGELALLLRQTLVPLPEERSRWFQDTRRAAREVLRALRAAGLAEDVTILQWRPLAEVATVLRRWRCRYEGDPLRREQLADVAQASWLGDNDAAPPVPTRAEQSIDVAEASGDGPRGLQRDNLLDWYRDMAPCWLRAEPAMRRRLVLRTHRWIAERVLGPLARGHEPAIGDLHPSGALAWLLVRMVPNGELATWTPWIRLVLTDLRRALSWPPGSRDAAWGRWLFLIPYGVNVGRAPAPNRQGGAPRQESRQIR